MIAAVGRVGRNRLARMRRTGTRVEAIAATGDRSENHQPAPQPSRALVATVPQPSPRPMTRHQSSAPFIAQLAAGHLGNLSTGDRRVRRDDTVVAPRATGLYRTADRMATEIEPGFLMKREY